MTTPEMDQEIQRLLDLDRPHATEELVQASQNTPFDFTRDYIDKLSLDRIRHLLLALFLHNEHKRFRGVA